MANCNFKFIYAVNIKSARCNGYCGYFVGSDQVWNMNWYSANHAFLLEFVPDNIPKFAYAASMPNNNLNSEQEEMVAKDLKRFQAISVREQITVDYLIKLTARNDIEHVLYPTLLLGRNEWENIAVKKTIGEKFIFCYFLGGERKMRSLANIYARMSSLKVVTLPHLSGIQKFDFAFGDYKLYDVSPNELLALIRDAEYVFTDSFHACVFANLFKTKYIVFSRSRIGQKMDSRVVTLLNLFNSSERFCDGDKASIEYINKVIDKELPINLEKFNAIKAKSEHFMQKCIELVGQNTRNEN